jgi:hypothetical protein
MWIVAASVLSYGQNKKSVSISPDTIGIKKISSEKSGLESKVTYKAEDSIYFDLNEKKVYLFHHSNMAYEDMELKAEYIIVDFNKKEVFARGGKDSSGKETGRPVFKQGDQKFDADEMTYNFETKKGISNGVVTSEGEGLVYGKKVLRDSTGNIYVKNARYTTCDDHNPHFFVSARKFKIIPGKQVVTGPANLVIADIKTPLVVPFGFFPVAKEAKRGILFGTYGETQDRGFYLRDFGFYTPVNSHMDMSLTADYYFRGSWGAKIRTNYKKIYKFSGNFGFNYNLNLYGEKESPEFRKDKDYSLNWQYYQDAKAKPGRNFSANVNYSNGRYFRNNSFDASKIVQSNANSSISYSKSMFNNKLNLSANGRLAQNLQTEVVDVDLPTMTLSVARWMPFETKTTPKQLLKNFGLSYQSNLSNQASVKEKNLFKATVLDSFRNGISHSIPISTSFKALKYFSLSPSLNFNEYWYFKTVRKTWDETRDTLITENVNGFKRTMQYNTSISLSTILYGAKTFKRGKIYAIRHVVRPQLSANWNPDFTKGSAFGYRDVKVDTLNRVARYSIFENGIVGYANGKSSASLNFGIGNNIEMKIRSAKDTANDGIKKLKLIESLNVSGGYNFLADSLKLSNIGINGNTTLFNKVQFNFSGTLDPYSFDSTNGSFYRVNKLAVKDLGKLGRFTNGNLSMSTNLNPRAKKDKPGVKPTEEEQAIIDRNPGAFVDFNLPWSLNISYNLSYSKQFVEKGRLDHSTTFSGDLSLTENWKIGLSSGYNFRTKELSMTKIDFFRNIHCWEFSVGWIPFGSRQSYDFMIRAKASSLRDALKLNRRGNWYDLN